MLGVRAVRIALRHAKAKGNPIFGGGRNGNSIGSLFARVTTTPQGEEKRPPKTRPVSVSLARSDRSVLLLVTM